MDMTNYKAVYNCQEAKQFINSGYAIYAMSAEARIILIKAAKNIFNCVFLSNSGKQETTNEIYRSMDKFENVYNNISNKLYMPVIAVKLSDEDVEIQKLTYINRCVLNEKPEE